MVTTGSLRHRLGGGMWLWKAWAGGMWLWAPGWWQGWGACRADLSSSQLRAEEEAEGPSVRDQHSAGPCVDPVLAPSVGFLSVCP